MALSPSLTCKNTPNITHRSLTPLSYVRSQVSRRNTNTPTVKVVFPKLISGTTNVRNGISHQKKPVIGCKFTAESDSSSEFHDVSDVLEKFRDYMNNNDIQQLQNLIHIDCCIEDTLQLQNTTKGMEEVMNLLKELAHTMSVKKLQLKLDKYIPGKEELMADVKWHIVLMDSGEPHPKNIRGTCAAHFLREGDNRLVIRKLVNQTMTGEEPKQEKPSSLPEQS